MTMLKSVTYRFLAVLACLALCVSMAAAEEISVSLTPDVTSCKPGEEITLTGEVRHPGTTLDGAMLLLAVETDPATEEIDQPLITSMNGKELDEDWWGSELWLEEEDTQGDLFRISGKWTMPEGAGFSKAILTLELYCEDDSSYIAACEVDNSQPVIYIFGLTVLQMAAILLAVIAVICGIWFLLHRKKDEPEQIPENGKGGRVLDTIIILLFFLGVIIMPVFVRVAFVYSWFKPLRYLSFLNFPCMLALLLSFFRLKKWTRTDLLFFAAWLLLLIPMLISNLKLELTHYILAPLQNLLPVYFIFYRMNSRSREKTIRLFMILFNSFIFILLAIGIEERITGNMIIKGFRDWLVSQNMYARDVVRFAGEKRFFSLWGHALTNALLFNSFLALNAAWYKSRGNILRALPYVPVAMAGVLLCVSKTGIVVCFLLLVIICWKYKKWLLVVIPILAALYFAGAFDTIIYRFTHTSLTTGRFKALAKYFGPVYSQYPLQWLTGYGSGIVMTAGHVLNPLRAGFEFPVLMSALDYGIVFSAVLPVGSYLYITWRCLKKKQWVIWLCFTLIFAEVNTYNGYSMRDQDIFIICNFMAMLILNMLPETAQKPQVPVETAQEPAVPAEPEIPAEPTAPAEPAAEPEQT